MIHNCDLYFSTIKTYSTNIRLFHCLYFSYDNRPRSLQAAGDRRHIIQSSKLQGRVNFLPGAVPALHIKPVLRGDEANYTCRVDFRIGKYKQYMIDNI